MESDEDANAIQTAEELERIVTIIQNPTQYKIPSCMSTPNLESFQPRMLKAVENMT